MEPLVVITRYNRVESIHYGNISVVNSQGKVIESVGNAYGKLFLRSSAKPFQSIPLIESEALKRYNITSKELAVVCSSHSGEDFHRETVDSILRKISLNENYLSCGGANPYNPEINAMLIRHNKKPTPLYNCCSGKHAGMLAVCAQLGFPLKNYTHITHPLQRLIIEIIGKMLNKNPSVIELGYDDCGTPSFLLTVAEGAYLYSQLAKGLKKDDNSPLSIIAKAMTAYPEMVNGDGEFCTDLIRSCKGKVIGKVGGEGVYCLALRDLELGVAIKITDGNERAVYPVACHVLRQLRVLDDIELEGLKKWNYPPIKNHKGVVNGYSVPAFYFDNKDREINLGDKFEFGDE